MGHCACFGGESWGIGHLEDVAAGVGQLAEDAAGGCWYVEVGNLGTRGA